MENISVEIIVALFAKYQFLTWGVNVFIGFSIVFGSVFVISLVVLLVGLDFNEEVDVLKIKKKVLMVSGLCFAVFLAGALFFSYQIEVVLKPEIAKYVVPVGVDITQQVTSEIKEMWDILKGVLK